MAAAISFSIRAAAVPSGGASVSSRNQPTNSASAKKWSGGVHLVLDCPIVPAWRLQSDFVGLTKWAPNISVCRLEEGEANAVGCLRYCKGTDESIWVNERLLEIDDARHYMAYRMEDNRFCFPEGFQGYDSKVQLGEAGERQTWVSWTYEVDPVVSATQETVTQFMIQFYTHNLKFLEDGANKLVAEENIELATS